MTFQERWAEGPPVGPAELLTPAEVREWLALGGMISPNAQRLGRDYLILWDRNKELEERLTPKHYDWPTPKNFQNPMGDAK